MDFIKTHDMNSIELVCGTHFIKIVFLLSGPINSFTVHRGTAGPKDIVRAII